MPFKPTRVFLYTVLLGISITTVAWTSSALSWYLRMTDSQGRPILDSRKPSSETGSDGNAGEALPSSENFFVLENEELPWQPMLGSHRGDYHGLIACLTWWIALGTLQCILICFSGAQELVRARHPPRLFAKLMLLTCLLSLLSTIFFKVALPLGLTRTPSATFLLLLAKDGVLVAFTFAWITTKPSRDDGCIFSDDHVGPAKHKQGSNTMSRSLARDGAVPVQAFRPHPNRLRASIAGPGMVSPPVKAQYQPQPRMAGFVRPQPFVTVPVPPSSSSASSGGSSASPACEAVSLMEPQV